VTRARWRGGALKAALALAGLNGAVYVAYTLPRSMRERSVAARVEVVRAEVGRERQRVEALRFRAETIRSNARDAERFHALLGAKSSLLSLREELAGTAQELGLRVGSRSYSFEPIKGASDVMRFEIRMPVSGTYAQLAAFLDRVERSPHFVTVDQIQLQQRTQGERAELSVVLSTFYRGTPTRERAAS
jgi:Tfp pilus assembly protein PilO